MTNNSITLQWEMQEETKLMNAQNILGYDCGVYYLGRFVNGKFFIPDRLQRAGFREVEIEKYAELPEEQNQ